MVLARGAFIGERIGGESPIRSYTSRSETLDRDAGEHQADAGRAPGKPADNLASGANIV